MEIKPTRRPNSDAAKGGSPSMPLRLSAVLVAFRRNPTLADVIQKSLNSGRIGQLLVVDNDSSPETRAIVADMDRQAIGPRLEYVDAGENLGPAGGWALGMEALLSAANDDDWVLILDDNNPPMFDDEIPKVFEMAVQSRKDDPSIGAVGIVGARFSWLSGLLKRVPDADLSGAVPVDYLGGGHMSMYSVAAIRRTGTFRPDLFFGSVEVEYGLRLRRAGWRILAHGELWKRRRQVAGRLNHRPTASPLCAIHWQKYYRIRNYIFMMRQFGRTDLALKWAVIQCVAKPLATCFRSPRLALAGFRQATRASWDGFRSRMGRTVEPG